MSYNTFPWEGHVHASIFKMDNQQGPIVWHIELCSMLGGSLDGRELWGRIDRCILEKEMATHSSVLAWRIPETGEPGGCRLWGHTESDTTEVI